MILDRGEVVQCVNVDPSARVTCWRKWGTTGAGRERGCFFWMWDRPYGEVECERAHVYICSDIGQSIMRLDR